MMLLAIEETNLLPQELFKLQIFEGWENILGKTKYMLSLILYFTHYIHIDSHEMC